MVGLNNQASEKQTNEARDIDRWNFWIHFITVRKNTDSSYQIDGLLIKFFLSTDLDQLKILSFGN